MADEAVNATLDCGVDLLAVHHIRLVEVEEHNAVPDY
jgi:hypothetical protein